MASKRQNIQNKADWENISSKEKTPRRVNLHKFDAEKQTLVLMGDEHIGSRFYNEDEHRRNLDWILENNIPVILMGDELECMDLNTKILTQDGWKLFEDLIDNDLVMTYNKEKDYLELQKTTKKVLHKYEGEMYHFKNKKLDMLVTPNHRILCRHHKNTIKVRRADKFTKKSATARCWNIPTTSTLNLSDYDILDDEIKLIGWIITEGWNYVRGNSIRYSTSQSEIINTENCKEIREIFNNLSIFHNEKTNDTTNVITWRFTDKEGTYKRLIGDTTKRITREILNNFSTRQLKILFETLLKGDGGNRGEFFTISKQLRDDFLELCCKIGKLTSVTKTRTTKGPNSNNQWKSKDMWIIYTGNGKGNKKTQPMKHCTITDLNIISFNDYVWCVSVPNSFLIVKRNNSVFITGNTATKTSVGAGIFEQSEIVQGQLEKAIKLYRPLAEKGLILGNHIGNHEARVYNHSGANLSKIFADMLGIKYLGNGAIHYIKVGNQAYLLYTTHGSSGARMPHTKIANTIKMNQMIDADIYAQGHLHQLSHHVQNYYAVDKRSKKLVTKQKHYIITGAYLDHWGSYAHTANMEPARVGSPKLKLGGLEKSIRVSLG